MAQSAKSLPGTGKTAQSAKCSPLTHEDLSLILPTKIFRKRLGAVVYTCNCSAGEVKIDRQMSGDFCPNSLAEIVSSGSGRDSA